MIGRPIPIEAKWPGRCAGCGVGFPGGEVIIREQKRGGKLWCLDCGLRVIGAPEPVIRVAATTGKATA